MPDAGDSATKIEDHDAEGLLWLQTHAMVSQTCSSTKCQAICCVFIRQEAAPEPAQRWCSKDCELGTRFRPTLSSPLYSKSVN